MPRANGGDLLRSRRLLNLQSAEYHGLDFSAHAARRAWCRTIESTKCAPSRCGSPPAILTFRRAPTAWLRVTVSSGSSSRAYG
jgi:hypothetical protein